VDVSAPVAALAAIDITPGAVFVFENLESVVAMPPLQDAVVIHGSGYAVDRLGRIPGSGRDGLCTGEILIRTASGFSTVCGRRVAPCPLR
jgi:hypothetical protein